MRRLREAGVDTATDEPAGGESYVKLRAGWNAHIERLAPAILGCCSTKKSLLSARRHPNANRPLS